MTSAGTSVVRSGVLTAGLLVLAASSAFAQGAAAPHFAAGRLPDGIVVDGRLDEAAWAASEAIDTFTQTDPNEGDASSERTTMRVLASSKALVIGITCDDSQPDAIVSYSVRRDASLNAEDHIRLVLGPFLDGELDLFRQLQHLADERLLGTCQRGRRATLDLGVGEYEMRLRLVTSGVSRGRDRHRPRRGRRNRNGGRLSRLWRPG